MRRFLLPLILFITVSSVYYATSAGITSSNDGSHYALLRAMVDEGQYHIETYAHFAEGNDLAIRDDVIYSDRPPGTALLSAPFYLLGNLLPRPIHDLPTRHDEGNPNLAYLMMLPALAGAGVVLILYMMLRAANLSQAAAFTTVLAFAFATTNWKYGGVLFSHSLSAFLVTGSTALTIHTIRHRSIGLVTGITLGLMLGLSVVVEYSNAVLVLLLMACIAITLRGDLLFTHDAEGGRSLQPTGLAALIVAGFLPAIFLLTYNRANFGGWLTTSYRYAINYPWASSFTSTFDVSWTQGLPAMLWYGHDALGEENQGLFLLMPITIVGLGGVWLYIKERGREAGMLLGVFTIFLLLFARHHTFSGFTADGRYLMPFLALWFIPVGFSIAWVSSQDEGWQKTLMQFLVYGLLFLSIRNMVAHIVFSFNYHLDPGLVARRAATPQNWNYILRSLFVNWQNLPLLWLVQALIIALGFGISRLRSYLTTSTGQAT